MFCCRSGQTAIVLLLSKHSSYFYLFVCLFVCLFVFDRGASHELCSSCPNIYIIIIPLNLTGPIGELHCWFVCLFVCLFVFDRGGSHELCSSCPNTYIIIFPLNVTGPTGELHSVVFAGVGVGAEGWTVRCIF